MISKKLILRLLKKIISNIYKYYIYIYIYIKGYKKVRTRIFAYKKPVMDNK